ncbi:hypothetical protein LINPERHAP1_LOCUS20419 [Linum perenne]
MQGKIQSDKEAAARGEGTAKTKQRRVGGGEKRDRHDGGGVVTARQHRPKKTLKHKVYKWRKKNKGSLKLEGVSMLTLLL